MPLIFGFCFVLSLLLAAVGIQAWGAAELRSHFGEIYFLTFVGAVWLIVATKIFAWFGLSLRDDAVERKNVGALAALCGALLTVAFTYTGGNLGEGPSFMNNFYSAGLAAAGLFGLWFVLELGANVSISIAEERDFASGLRLCGFLLAIGLVLGRAVAGDWHSTEATLHDFVRDGWFAGLFTIVAIFVERLLRPSRGRPFPKWQSAGLLPALVYLGLAAGWLWHLGRWEGMSR